MPYKNPQIPKIVLYHKHEIVIQQGKQYCIVTDKAGTEHKISEKRQGLWGLFDNARDGEPFLFIYETYNNVQYISDAKPITDDLLKVAVSEMATKLANSLTEERNRSTSLSYSKDLVIGGKIEIGELFSQAQKHYEFIKGERRE